MNTTKKMNQKNPHIEKLQKDLRHQEAVVAKTLQKLRIARKGIKPHVSDHALVRFLERVHGIDMDSIRQSIVTPQLFDLFTKLGDGEFPIGDDKVRAIIENGVVVTILT